MTRPARYLSGPPHPAKRPDGTRQCRWCATDELEPGRRSWCSEACVDEYNVRAGNWVARIVFKRDRGVCVRCGIDTDRVEKSWRRWWVKRHRWWRVMALAGRPVPSHRTSFFDIDHVVSVEDGGGSCGLDNLQTLCLWCHAAKTKRQAGARARQRKLPMVQR